MLSEYRLSLITILSLILLLACKKQKVTEEVDVQEPKTVRLNKLLFTAKTSDKPLVYQLFTMNPDGTSPKQLTFFETSADYLYTGAASWSPDGEKIIFTSNKDGRYNGDELYMMNSDGTNVIKLTTNGRSETNPSFSPDGKKILFSSLTAAGKYNFFTMNADGADEKQLTFFDNGTSFSFVGFGSWSPDGQHIVFTSNKDQSEFSYSQIDIYTMASTGLDVKRLTDDERGKTGCTYSPDGNKILFEAITTENPSHTHIFTMNPDGTAEKQITSFTSNTQVNTHGSSWAPDSKEIVFVSNMDGFDKGGEIFKINVDGGGLTKLTNSSMDPKTPKWR